MKLEFYNCPKPADIKSVTLPEKPGFLSYQPDFVEMHEFRKKYAEFKNILLIGNGGSINCFIADYFPLKYQSDKNVYILNTVDPDYIYELKSKLKPENTLVVAVSKSGENVMQIEAMMQFSEFAMLVITGRSSPVRAVAEKLEAKIVMHPPIGGRYNSLTEVALLPAALCGIEVEHLFEGAEKIYHKYDQDNDSWRAASVMCQLEQNGYVDVFMPVYSHNLFPVSSLIVQLCHESFGKSGKGQTYFAHEAPESQHHTNQRFFGGQKNICGFFLTAEEFMHPTTESFPAEVSSVQIKGRTLGNIDKIPLQKAMQFEAEGTMEDAKIHGIPLAHLSVANFSAEAIGELAAFWQLYAVYSSVLRGVDPFDQPQVENSKNISFNKRLAYNGLL